MPDFHEWYDENLQRLVKGTLYDALQEAWQEADKQSKECITEKPEPIDHRTVTMRNGVVTQITHVNYLPDDGVYKLYAVRIDDE
jgi:hypothetical protein